MITIVCPVHNHIKSTKRCIKSLSASIENSKYKDDIDIVFVDDGSTDGTDEWINENYPAIKVLKGDGNLWWSGAMNMGAEHALKSGAEYVFVINNDNIFDTGCLDKLIDYSKQNNINIVGSQVRNLRTDTIWSLGGYFNQDNGNMRSYKDINHLRNSDFKVDWIPGMGTLIHRSVFETIGFWNNTDFPQYYGDSDFVLRAGDQHIEAHICIKSIIWNDTTTTGILHDGSFFQLLKSLFSIKSYYNLPVTLKFLSKHKVKFTGRLTFLTIQYGRYIGGFFKHKIINLLRYKKTI